MHVKSLETVLFLLFLKEVFQNLTKAAFMLLKIQKKLLYCEILLKCVKTFLFEYILKCNLFL